MVNNDYKDYIFGLIESRYTAAELVELLGLTTEDITGAFEETCLSSPELAEELGVIFDDESE